MLFKKKVSRIPEPPQEDFQETREIRRAGSKDLFDKEMGDDFDENSFAEEMPKKGKRKIEEVPEESESADELPEGIPEDFSFKQKRERKQIFVKIDKFKQIVASLESIENKLKELDSIMTRLEELSSDENSEIESWKSDVEGIKGEIRNISSNLAED